ncbi:DUF6350 family protein [Spirillospora sp. NPDC029432]|uniref:cell division protein PerM n=1 Tax=Spirillospora sp. NPDC029432 TaxID=3154599 RepID=UPI0034536831
MTETQRRPEPSPEADGASRPLYVTGLVGALWCIGIGLALLTTVTLIGWIAAPRTALGPGLQGVFRTAVNLWLVSHHAGISVPQGRIGLLPLGTLVLPGALLYRSGGWVIRAAGVPGSPRMGVVRVAFALAVPYSILAGLLALAAASSAVSASPWESVAGGLAVAVIAGGLGAARALAAARGPGIRSGLGALLNLLPERPRSLVIGVSGATAVLLASGAVLVGASLAMHVPESTEVYDTLAPGIVGGILLLVVELAFLPNAVIWGVSYAVGPGFSVGAGTGVSPSGVFLDSIPAFPPLAALPEAGPAPLISLLALAAPFLAGAVGGVLTIRAMPSAAYEAAPLWGFLCGALTGAVTAFLSALAGGPLGGGRMATVGPSPWQVGLLATLEVGISAAVVAWLANWRVARRTAAAGAEPEPSARPPRRRDARKAARSGENEKPAKRRKAAAPMLAAPVFEDDAPPPAPEPRERPAPAPAAPARKPAPYTEDPLEFEEAEPILAPRRPAKARGRAAAPPPEIHEEEPAPEPEPEPEPDWAADAEYEEYEEHAEPEPRDVPAPREDPERTENRGGAIYVLREDPRQE